jgi:hypothetical protein
MKGLRLLIKGFGQDIAQDRRATFEANADPINTYQVM